MRRREFVAGLICAVLPQMNRALSAPKVFRVGFLGLAPASAWSGEVNAFRGGLRELGYVEGPNIALDFRWAATGGEMRNLTDELVRSKADVIIAPGSTQVEPAREETKTI